MHALRWCQNHCLNDRFCQTVSNRTVFIPVSAITSKISFEVTESRLHKKLCQDCQTNELIDVYGYVPLCVCVYECESVTKLLVSVRYGTKCGILWCSSYISSSNTYLYIQALYTFIPIIYVFCKVNHVTLTMWLTEMIFYKQTRLCQSTVSENCDVIQR